MTRILSLGVLVGCLFTRAELLQGAEEPMQIDPQAAAVLKAAGEYLKQLQSFRCQCASSLKVTFSGKTQEMTDEYSIALARPNRVAVLLKQGQSGASIVSDGKQAYHHVPALNKFITQAAPESLDELFAGPSALFFRQVGAMFIPVLAMADPTKELLEGVTGGKHLGEEELAGVKCHRLRFFQKEMDWDVWIETGERPLIHKCVPDTGKSFKAGGAAGLGDLKMEAAVTFKDWQTNVEVPAETFRFQPPADAKLVESFLDRPLGREEQGPHPLVGKPAPALEAKLLEGEPLKLADLQGKVVILDFWATWCGPCVKGLPIVAQVAKSHERQGVAFFAVNVGEEVDEIREFLKAQQLQIKVALDPDSKLSERYGVQGIPQTVLIGKDGKVHVVHVGLDPDLKGRLNKELDALVKGEDLAAKARRENEEAKRAAAGQREGATLLWSLPGGWSAVTTSLDLAVAAKTNGAAVWVDASGNQQRELTMKSRASMLRTANLSADKGPALLGFSLWGQSVEAWSIEGQQMWTYGGGQGIDDVWAFDLDGDKLDEVLIGYNGATGLHVLDSRGQLRWKCTDIGNVWHVSAGDVIGDNQVEVVTTSAAGKVHLFDQDGNRLKDLDAGLYANLVRITPPVAGEKATILVGGSDLQGAGKLLMSINAEGDERWSVPLESHIDSAQISSSRPWIGVGQRNGKLLVVDVTTGKVVARIPGQGARPQIAWFERTAQSPLLLVATGGELNAFTIQESN